MPERMYRVGFLAEVETTDETVRLAHVKDPATQVVISRDWWEQLGSPESVQVMVEPDEPTE